MDRMNPDCYFEPQEDCKLPARPSGAEISLCTACRLHRLTDFLENLSEDGLLQVRIPRGIQVVMEER